jgi:hypothetical protein
MLSRRWRLAIFALAFLSLQSQLCAAGPIHRRPPIIEIVDCTRQFSFASSTFRQYLPFPPSPTTAFHLDAVVLTRASAPPEFRRPYPKATSVTTDIFHALRSHPSCRLAPWLPGQLYAHSNTSSPCPNSALLPDAVTFALALLPGRPFPIPG